MTSSKITLVEQFAKILPLRQPQKQDDEEALPCLKDRGSYKIHKDGEQTRCVWTIYMPQIFQCLHNVVLLHSF